MSFFDLFDIPQVDDDEHFGVFPPRAEDTTTTKGSSPKTTTTTTRPMGAGVVPYDPTTWTRTSSSTVPTSSSSQLTSTTLTSTISTPAPPTPPIVTPTRSATSTVEQPPAVVTNIKTTTMSTSSTPTPSQDSSVADSQSKGASGPSPVALGVTLTVVILMVLLAGLYLFRRHHINKRKNRRQTWTNAIKSSTNGQGTHGDEEAYGTKQAGQDYDRFDDIDINEKKSAVPLPDNFTLQNTAAQGGNYPYPSPPQSPYARNDGAQFGLPVSLPAPPPPLHPTGIAPIRAPSPPPMHAPVSAAPAPLGLDTTTPGLATAYNTQVTPLTQFAPVATPSPTMVSSFNAPHTGAPSNGVLLTVARTFVPSLPDELPVQIGEQVRVIEKYDDGWALCERMKAGAGVESGVVPVECLQYATAIPGDAGPVPGMGMMQERVDNWRLSHRNSSLHPVGKY